MCEMQYFAEYVLGIHGPSGQKADKGTITHKILEILAAIKKAQQDNKNIINDDIMGEINTQDYSLDTIIDRIYDHYSIATPYHKWTPKDKADCGKWAKKAIEYHGGAFDPRNRNIICPEQRFDIQISKPWAAFDYQIDGKRIEGYLGLKGTIDLITEIDENTIEVIDWKTGRRVDWATGKEKTQEKLQDDPQLRIYHYAVSKLFPHIKHIIITIYFINDGGPFSVCFDETDLETTEKMIQTKFEKIKKTKRPKLTKTWMCSKLCHFGKTTFENTHVAPTIEYRDYQSTHKDKIMTKCEQIKHEIDLTGMDNVVASYLSPGYTIGAYKPPGQV